MPFPSPGDLPNPEMELISHGSPTMAGGFFTTESHGEPLSLPINIYLYICLPEFHTFPPDSILIFQTQLALRLTWNDFHALDAGILPSKEFTCLYSVSSAESSP